MLEKAVNPNVSQTRSLKPGVPASALIKASHVVIGVRD